MHVSSNSRLEVWITRERQLKETEKVLTYFSHKYGANKSRTRHKKDTLKLSQKVVETTHLSCWTPRTFSYGRPNFVLYLELYLPNMNITRRYNREALREYATREENTRQLTATSAHSQRETWPTVLSSIVYIERHRHIKRTKPEADRQVSVQNKEEKTNWPFQDIPGRWPSGPLAPRGWRSWLGWRGTTSSRFLFRRPSEPLNNPSSSPDAIFAHEWKQK